LYTTLVDHANQDASPEAVLIPPAAPLTYSAETRPLVRSIRREPPMLLDDARIIAKPEHV
jgi:hypothetical protein